jgi:hypothetical protein
MTPVAAPNEIDSDHEAKSSKEILIQNFNQQRPFTGKKPDTDSDDAFLEV